MKKRLLELVKKPFIRNVIIMATGTFAAQLVNLLLQPVITRLYGPEAFGLMGVFMAIVGIITPIAALTYPIGIVLPKNDGDAKGLIRLSLYLSMMIAVFVALILFLFYEPIVNLFQLEGVSDYLYLIPFVVLSSGILQVTEQWLIRKKQFGVSAKAAFSQAVILQGGKAGLGVFYPIAPVLIILTAFGEGLKAIMMLIFSRGWKVNKSSGTSNEKASILELAKRHRDFPFYRAPEVFINAASQSLPILMLTSYFGPASAGFYTICKTVLSLPTQLIGKSVGDVFYPRASEAASNKESLTALIKKATISLGAVGIIPYGIVILFGPWLFSFVFGTEWEIAGEYARWIALWSFMGFMNRPSVMALPVLSAQAFQLKYTIFMLITRIGALALGYYVFSSDKLAIAMFGVSGALLNFGLILLTIRISKKYDKVNLTDRNVEITNE